MEHEMNPGFAKLPVVVTDVKCECGREMLKRNASCKQGAESFVEAKHFSQTKTLLYQHCTGNTYDEF